jgi:hypothetical protein
MVYFQTQIPVLGKFWMVLERKVLVYFMALWSVLWLFGIFYGHLVYFGLVSYIFLPRFGMLHKEKSGNTGQMSAPSYVQIVALPGKPQHFGISEIYQETILRLLNLQLQCCSRIERLLK